MKFKVLFIIWSCIFCLAANNCCVSSCSVDLAKELKSLEKNIPLPYHNALDKTVKQLSAKSLPTTFTKYEAFVDTALVQRGMPLELRYLPYALSGMRADFSYGDRCGYWALPSLVAIHYGLAVDESRDERLSVEASTLVALDYINDLHNKYNDWWYSILAYANSPTSLSHALIHHGDAPALWDFYEQELMPDVNIIPDFATAGGVFRYYDNGTAKVIKEHTYAIAKGVADGGIWSTRAMSLLDTVRKRCAGSLRIFRG